MILNVLQLILAATLCGAVLLQSRGSGAGFALGGDGNVYRTRRGIEKKLHGFTIIVAALFFAVALLNTLYTF